MSTDGCGLGDPEVAGVGEAGVPAPPVAERSGTAPPGDSGATLARTAGGFGKAATSVSASARCFVTTGTWLSA